MYQRNYPYDQDRTIKRQFSGTHINVDDMRDKLSDYGIDDIQVTQSGNMKTVTVTIRNPTQKQMEGLNNILSCKNEYNSIRKECRDFFDSPFRDSPFRD